jgi:hypothetical protein
LFSSALDVHVFSNKIFVSVQLFVSMICRQGRRPLSQRDFVVVGLPERRMLEGLIFGVSHILPIRNGMRIDQILTLRLPKAISIPSGMWTDMENCWRSEEVRNA